MYRDNLQMEFMSCIGKCNPCRSWHDRHAFAKLIDTSQASLEPRHSRDLMNTAHGRICLYYLHGNQTPASPLYLYRHAICILEASSIYAWLAIRVSFFLVLILIMSWTKGLRKDVTEDELSKVGAACYRRVLEYITKWLNSTCLATEK